MRASLIFGILFLSHFAFAMDLEQFLTQVKARHGSLKSLESKKEASSLRREAGDVELSPALTLSARRLDDRKQQLFGGNFLIDRTEATDYSVGLSKKFSTGTNAQLSASLNETSILASSQNFAFATGSLGISLSQSFWKDGFGRSTFLRRNREISVETTEKTTYDLQEKQLLIEAEAAFWDYLYISGELAARRDSLERAKRIETWVRRRVANGIGDQADLYNAQGLVANRELQLIATQDEVAASEKKLRDLLELPDREKLPVITGDLSGERNLEQLAGGGPGRRTRLESYLAVLEAKTRAIAADEVEESFRPDLSLEAQYKTNSFEPTLSQASSSIGSTKKPTTAIGLKFSWLLDWEVKNAARGTARSEALAAALKKERSLREGDTGWSEILRRHQELTKKIKAAQFANEIQTKKAAAERDKLSKGRTITSQVVMAEQDAAEAQLTLQKLRAEQRKLEAQGRLFITVEE